MLRFQSPAGAGEVAVSLALPQWSPYGVEEQPSTLFGPLVPIAVGFAALGTAALAGTAALGSAALA